MVRFLSPPSLCGRATKKLLFLGIPLGGRLFFLHKAAWWHCPFCDSLLCAWLKTISVAGALNGEPIRARHPWPTNQWAAGINQIRGCSTTHSYGLDTGEDIPIFPLWKFRYPVDCWWGGGQGATGVAWWLKGDTNSDQLAYKNQLTPRGQGGTICPSGLRAMFPIQRCIFRWLMERVSEWERARERERVGCSL